MIELADVSLFSGFIIGAFASGYAASWLWYIFRRVMWSIT